MEGRRESSRGAKGWSVSERRRVVPTTTSTINTTYLTRAPSCPFRGGTGGRDCEGRDRVTGGSSSSCLVRSSKLISGDINNSRLLTVHRRYNGRGVRESAVGLTVPVCRDGVMSHLGRSVEVVVIDRIRTGRVLGFITRPPKVSDERSALEARRGNHRVRRDPGAFGVPLGAVLDIESASSTEGEDPLATYMWNRPIRVDGQSRSQLARQRILGRFSGRMGAVPV